VPGSAPGAPSQTIGEAGCPADPSARKTVPLHTPALGMSADYGLPPSPNTQLPNPNGKSTWSLNYSKAGVDTGEIIIRGGSHLDFSFIPNQAFGASLRGPDMIDWYTTAWFDKYVKHSPNADRELLSTRWLHDPTEASVDPGHDGNAFSFYYYSRLDFHAAGGQQVDCEDLRDGCSALSAGDGWPGTYSYLSIDTGADAVSGPGAPLRSSSRLSACSARSGALVHVRRFHGRPITRVVVYVDGRRASVVRARSVRSVRIPGFAGSARHRVRLWEYSRSRLARRVTLHVWGCGRAR
jgi:hypothetical protein